MASCEAFVHSYQTPEGHTRYLVAEYRDGRYYAPQRPQIVRLTGAHTIYGPLWYVIGNAYTYARRSDALRRARDLYLLDEPPDRVLGAQMIRPYHGPQWLVEPAGPISDRQDLEAINAAGYEVLTRRVRGWGPHLAYNAIIRVHAGEAGDTDYLARLAGEPEEED